MDAIELLKADHKIVAGLFKEVEDSADDKHPAIFVKIKAELDAHMHIEETLFYPALEADGDKELVDITLEGIEEHHQVKMFLKELEALTENSEKFKPKLTVLIEDVEHHVKEEEETMFPLVEAQFDAVSLDELGDAMEAEKLSFQKSRSATA
jgi:iron-sulfur cluster repair protein YtfE (RIC family)